MEFRAGDRVRHKPSGETWVVAHVDYGYGDLYWVGWPDGRARVDQCDLVAAASDTEHLDVLCRVARIRGVGTTRVRGCRRALIDWALAGKPVTEEALALLAELLGAATTDYRAACVSAAQAEGAKEIAHRVLLDTAEAVAKAAVTRRANEEREAAVAVADVRE